MTAGYLGIPLPAVYDLELIEYLTYRRDAFIWYFSRTEAGQEYLDNAYRCEQTEPDRAALRAKFGRKGERTDGG